MTYLPPIKIDPTHFPQALGQDVLTAIRMIEERWRRAYPLIDYTSLDKRATVAVTTQTAQPLSGESGSTKFDPVWGESIDKNMSVWAQPQTTPGAIVAEPNVYLQAKKLHARIQRTARENQLKKLGFDRIRDMIICIPTSMLDAAGVTVTAGDRFSWNNEEWEVIQHHIEGWWYQANVNLYVWMNCQHARRGS